MTTVNAPGTPEVRERKKKPKAEGNENESDEEGDDGSESEDERNEVLNDMTKPTEEEEDLDFDDEISKKERILETKSKVTHPVHCPYFPEVCRHSVSLKSIQVDYNSLKFFRRRTSGGGCTYVIGNGNFLSPPPHKLLRW